ncbi:hypothetical protein RIF29_20744 [Crotalaria pallida]|uniref:Uncharacterized protein n=1 Tax=Crotalaria pallida TaxID=3830 RepID=A0AAN9I7S7_CROPI
MGPWSWSMVFGWDLGEISKAVLWNALGFAFIDVAVIKGECFKSELRNGLGFGFTVVALIKGSIATCLFSRLPTLHGVRA